VKLLFLVWLTIDIQIGNVAIVVESKLCVIHSESTHEPYAERGDKKTLERENREYEAK
jgi:hypothetical protein